MSLAARLLAVVLCLVAYIALFAAAPDAAHEMRPAYLELTERTPDVFDVLFKTPMQGDLRLALSVAISGQVEPTTPVVSRVAGNAMIQTWQIRATAPLAGQQVRVAGLENTLSDALLRIEFLDGRSWEQRLT